MLEQLNISVKEKDEYFSQMINRMIQINQKVTCNKIGKNEKTIVLGTPEQYLLEIQNSFNMVKIVKYLKGGSLSGTFIIRKKYVTCKKTSFIKKNREFGFQRWLSQLKKIQYYNSRVKNIFPKIIDAGSSKKKLFLI